MESNFSIRYLIVLGSVDVRIYQITTRQCIRRIAVDGTKYAHMYLGQNGKLWLFSQLGQGIFVDLEDENGQIFLTTLDLPIYEIVDIIDDKTFIIISSLDQVSSKSIPGHRYLLKHTLKDGKSIFADENVQKSKDSSRWDTSVIFHIDYSKNFAISNNKKYFAFTTSYLSDTVVAGQLDEEYNLIQAMEPIQRKHRTRAIAISDTGVVAVGSVGGAIDLYYEIFDKNRPSIIFPRALKWHIDPARALSFSLDGNYLLSGGNEKVLVFWQLDTGRSQFLPRLTGEISDIVVDSSSELYAVRMADNEIVIFSSLDLLSRLQIAGVKAQILSSQQLANDSTAMKSKKTNTNVPVFSCPFFINPKTKSSYIPLTYSSLIQVYDTNRDEQVGMITVAPALQTGKVKVETQIRDPKVTHVSFTPDGKWMATVDEYIPPSIDPLLSKGDREINLKIWRNTDGNWVLTTRISAPHGTNVRISNLIAAGSYYNNGHAFLTSSEHGGLRLWMPELISPEEVSNEGKISKDAIIKVDKSRLNYSWSVRKDIPGILHTPSRVSASWSTDGSVIVLSLGGAMYIVDGESFEIKASLPNIVDTSIYQLHIIGSRLVILSQTRLAVYDLINGAQVWSVGITVPELDSQNLLAVDSSNGLIALAVNNQGKNKIARIIIFSIDTPVPVHVENVPSYILCIRHVPSTSSTFQILNPDLRFSTLSPATEKQSNSTFELQQHSTSFEDSISNLYSSSNGLRSSTTAPALDFDSVSDVITATTFDSAFEDAQTGGCSMNELFENVFSVLANKAN